MKKRKKRVIMARIATLKEVKLNDDFDIKFWHRAGVFARFSAAWEMIGDFYKMRGRHGYIKRLQRSIQNIQQA